MPECTIYKQDQEFYYIYYTGFDIYCKQALEKLSLSSTQYIIKKEHYIYLDLIKKLLQKDSFVLAIDGKCASGKTTLASLLQDKFHASVIHMDDFYLPIDQRKQTVAGHMDFSRLIDTVLKHIKNHQDIYYQVFDCRTQSYREDRLQYNKYYIIEGSYSLHPSLVEYYTDTVVLDVLDDIQQKRLFQRNPLKYQDFIEHWIPLEQDYFKTYHIYERYPVIKQ